MAEPVAETSRVAAMPRRARIHDPAEFERVVAVWEAASLEIGQWPGCLPADNAAFRHLVLRRAAGSSLGEALYSTVQLGEAALMSGADVFRGTAAFLLCQHRAVWGGNGWLEESWRKRARPAAVAFAYLGWVPMMAGVALFGGSSPFTHRFAVVLFLISLWCLLVRRVEAMGALEWSRRLGEDAEQGALDLLWKLELDPQGFAHRVKSLRTELLMLPFVVLPAIMGTGLVAIVGFLPLILLARGYEVIYSVSNGGIAGPLGVYACAWSSAATIYLGVCLLGALARKTLEMLHPPSPNPIGEFEDRYDEMTRRDEREPIHWLFRPL